MSGATRLRSTSTTWRPAQCSDRSRSRPTSKPATRPRTAARPPTCSTSAPTGPPSPYERGNDIVLLDAQTLTARARLLGHQALVKTMGFSHDGTRLASGDDDGAIIVWDVATGAPVEQLAGHTESVHAVAFGGHDDTLYSTAADRTLLAWDLRGDRRFIPRLATAPDPERVPADASRPGDDGHRTRRRDRRLLLHARRRPFWRHAALLRRGRRPARGSHRD